QKCFEIVACLTSLFFLTGSSEICLQPPLKGSCRAIHYRWYYDKHSHTCVPFIYGGCQGNDNNFISFTECSETCK
uniref:BPTI/Kunitz inhibitor domain-containing protein n=1 Tax=Pseudonaja textilis TaxID=8673 RepID=A0A670YBY2_PSETE